MNLVEALPQEQKRCRELLEVYRSIGPAGTFGAMVIQGALERADIAASSGDVVAMIQAYEELKGCE